MEEIFFIGNEESMKVHSPYCEWIFKMRPEKIIKFEQLHDALSAGYEECNFCLGKGLAEVFELKRIREENGNKVKTEVKNLFQECICCGGSRGVQRAHIIPKRHHQTGMTMPLCPTCHWNYDHDLISLEEWEKIKYWIDAEMRRRLGRNEQSPKQSLVSG